MDAACVLAWPQEALGGGKQHGGLSCWDLLDVSPLYILNILIIISVLEKGLLSENGGLKPHRTL